MTKLSQTKNTSSWWIWLALVATLFLTYQMYAESEREETEAKEVIFEANSANRRLGATSQAKEPASLPVVEEQVKQQQVFEATQHSTKSVSIESAPRVVHDSEGMSQLTNRTHVNIAQSSLLFLPKQWLPPPAPVKVMPVPPPTAPPLPFAYVGEMDEMPTGKKVILMAQQKVHMPMLGEKLMGVWRLDKVDSNWVYFTYMPLSLVKTLSKSAKSPSPSNPSLGAAGEPLESEDPN